MRAMRNARESAGERIAMVNFAKKWRYLHNSLWIVIR
jgi:hypothetical protein